jgi:GTP-binding protein
VLAITKCDMIDEELSEMLRDEISRRIDESLPVVFISAVAQQGLDQLKDTLWDELNSESNKLQSITAEDVIVHRDKDMSRFSEELLAEGEDEEIEFIDEDEIEDVDEEL